MSINRIPRALVTLGMALAVFGCSNGSTVLQTQKLGKDESLVTSADVRTITRTDISKSSEFGRVMPSSVVCAEPSPDVAKAVSESFQLDSKVAAEVAGKGGGSLALAMARERAEAIAQMTERLATIQLLRDGMYRACEAYANGALSKTEYAVILSRYDDTMVTLLLGELAAGSFGRPLARLGSGAAARLGEAGEDAEAAEKAADEKIAAKRGEVAGLDQQIAGKQSELAAADDASEGQLKKDLTDLRSRRATAAAEVAELKLQKALASNAAAGGSAIATSFETGATALAMSASKVADTLEQMQKNYLHDINSDAVETACLSVLSETPKGSRPELVGHCIRDVFPRLQEARSRLLQGLIARAEARSRTAADQRREAVTAGPGKDLLIKSVQKMLKEAGYKVGPVDGVYGPQTVAAIRDFEEEHPDAPKYRDDPLGFAIGVRKITGQ